MPRLYEKSCPMLDDTAYKLAGILRTFTDEAMQAGDAHAVKYFLELSEMVERLPSKIRRHFLYPY